MDFVIENWIPLLAGALALAKVIVNLTPSEDDNKVFAILDKIVNALIPNLKKGGGKH